MKNRILKITIFGIVLCAALCFYGCGKTVEGSKFVKNLICSCETDIEIEFKTDKEFDRKVVGLEIPDLPEGFCLDFYDEEVEEWSDYNMHILSFDITEAGAEDTCVLTKPLIFHEVIVTWDDGSEIKADIGTIHLTTSGQTQALENWGGEYIAEGDVVYSEEDIFATEDMIVTDIEIPYSQDISGLLTELCFGDMPASEISEEHPLPLKKGETYTLTYTLKETAGHAYGKIFLQGEIKGETTQGNPVLTYFYVQPTPEKYLTD